MAKGSGARIKRQRVVGLFAGIGGIEEGLRRAGHATSLLCELDPAARAVLSKHFPDAGQIVPDVTELRAAGIPRGATLLTAGFPCQDLSQAGRTAGIEGTRSGLVQHVFRLLDELKSWGRPMEWVLLENVSFMLGLGGGHAMRVVLERLEELGYRWAYRVVDTRAFGLPQRRERVYILASQNHDPRTVLFADNAARPVVPKHSWRRAHGFYWTEGNRGLGWAVDAVPTLKGGSGLGIPSPPAIVMPRGGGIVVPDIRDAERLQGFPANWTLPAEQVDKAGHRWKLIGNAVTVAVAKWIGKRLLDPGDAGRQVPHRELAAGERWPDAAWGDGGKRYGAELTRFPFAKTPPSLVDFLRHEPRDLSARATRGFRDRFMKSSLLKVPGLEERLENHLMRMERLSAAVH